MTHQKSYSKGVGVRYFSALFKRSWPQTLLYFLVIFLTMTVPILLQVSNYVPQGDYAKVLLDFYKIIVSVNAYTSLFIAIFAGCGAFAYFSKKRSGYFYHSLPIRREELFTANTLSGFSSFLIGTVANYMLSFMIVVIFSLTVPGSTSIFLQGFAWSVLMFVLMFSVTTFAGSICASRPIHFLVTIFFSGILPLYYLAVIALPNIFAEHSSFYPIKDYALLIRSSPFAYALFPRLDYDNISYFSFSREAAIVLISSAVLIALSLLIYKKRKIENCEQPISLPWMGSVLKYLILFPASLFTALFFYMIADYNIVWLYIGLAIGLILVFMLVNTILYKSAKKMFSGIKALIVFTVFMVLFIIGSIAYTNYRDNYSAPSSDISYITVYTSDVPIVNVKMSDKEEIATLMSDLAAIRDENNIFKKGFVTTDSYNFITADSYNKTTMDDSAITEHSYFPASRGMVSYEIKPRFGPVINLSFSLYEGDVGEKTIKLLLSHSTAEDIIGTNVYSSADYVSISLDDTFINVKNSGSTSYTIPCDIAIPLLLADYDLSFEDVQSPKIGYLYIYTNNARYGMSIPLYRSCENILKYIEKNLMGKTVDDLYDDIADSLESIEVSRKLTGEVVSVHTDKEEILALLGAMVNPFSRYSSTTLHITDNEYHAKIVFKNEFNESYSRVESDIPLLKYKLPDFLKNK